MEQKKSPCDPRGRRLNAKEELWFQMWALQKLSLTILTRQIIERGSEGVHVRGRRKERKEPVKMGECGFDSALINNFFT